MTYDWLYLCGDPAKLHITLDFLFLQGNPPVGLNKMIIGYCSHLDPANRYKELEDVCYRRRPGWINCEIRDLSYLHVILPAPLERYWSNDKTRWSLAVKTLIPTMFAGPFLYTDDDVVMFSDPIELLSPRGWGSKGSFRLPIEKRYVAEQMFDAMALAGYGADKDARTVYNEHALDAGVFWSGQGWGEWSAKLWMVQLENFSKCDYIRGLTTNNLELRCLDQRFLTAWGYQNGWAQQTISNGFAPPKTISDGLTKRHEFLHYKTSSKLSKSRWMQALRDCYMRLK